MFFAERGDTKLDLVRYYLPVEEPLLAAMGGRPVLLQRFPNGAGGSSFFQKRVPEDAARRGCRRRSSARPTAPRPRRWWPPTWPTSLWAVNLGCLGFHVWPSTAADPEHADELRIDLDPTPGVTSPMVQEAAHEVQALLDELGVAGLPEDHRQPGHPRLRPAASRGGTPTRCGRRRWRVARELERRRPDLITAAWWKEERGERVFVDFNQNAPHKTDLRGVVGAGPARRPGVDAVRLGRARRRSTPTSSPSPPCPPGWPRDGDPWAAMDDRPQSLEPLLALHERDRAAGLLDAPWPPVYPKMPDEPPRVAPSRAKARPD